MVEGSETTESELNFGLSADIDVILSVAKHSVARVPRPSSASLVLRHVVSLAPEVRLIDFNRIQHRERSINESFTDTLVGPRPIRHVEQVGPLPG